MDINYTLNELSRACGRSKSTLLTMIADGLLVAEQESTGRREWTITQTNAHNAGLQTARAESIDTAMRQQLQEEFTPLAEQIRCLRVELQDRLSAIEAGIHQSQAKPSLVRRIAARLR